MSHIETYFAKIASLSVDDIAAKLSKRPIAVIVVAIALVAAMNWSPAMWGLSSLACGGLLGFLFGIPRVEQIPEIDDGTKPKTTYRQSVNTNLTEISDWLTKIIVGVSLVQLNQIPPAFQSLVDYLSDMNYRPGMVGGILVFFGVAGFLAGYLLTRLYLASAFSEADRKANAFNANLESMAIAAINSQVKLHSEPLPDVPPTTTTTQPPRPSILNAGSMASLQTVDDYLKSIMPPRESVLRSWDQVVESLRENLRKKRMVIDRSEITDGTINFFEREKIFEDADLRVLRKLKNMQQLAVQSSDEISDSAAKVYRSLANGLISRMNNWPDDNTQSPSS